MSDLFNATILCENCNAKTQKAEVIKEGFRLRALKCPGCNKVYIHPTDQQKLDQFIKLKQKHYEVKLRMVGNSYTISIPKEIISYQDEIQKNLNKMLFLALEEPEKLSIFFKRRRFFD